MGDRRTDLENELWAYLTGVDDRERAADDRNRDLVQVHRDGWKNLATALAGGLRLIAEAIRDHSRR